MVGLLTCYVVTSADVTVELEDIVDAVNVSRTIVNPWATILRRRYRPQLVISILIPTFQQWVGINVSRTTICARCPARITVKSCLFSCCKFSGGVFASALHCAAMSDVGAACM
jgi:hypothetical protein